MANLIPKSEETLKKKLQPATKFTRLTKGRNSSIKGHIIATIKYDPHPVVISIFHNMKIG